jgi:hypothetical protein
MTCANAPTMQRQIAPISPQRAQIPMFSQMLCMLFPWLIAAAVLLQ